MGTRIENYNEVMLSCFYISTTQVLQRVSEDTMSYPRCSGHHSVGEHKQIQTNQLENVLKKPNDLQSQHILEKHTETTREIKSGFSP